MATETALAKGQSRVLSKPSSPRSNDGRDNANDDLIIRTGEELGERVGSAANATTTGHHHKGHHPRDDEDMSDESTTYTVLDSLGSGTFGQVVAAASSADGQTRALKVIKNHPRVFSPSARRNRHLTNVEHKVRRSTVGVGDRGLDGLLRVPQPPLSGF